VSNNNFNTFPKGHKPNFNTFSGQTQGDFGRTENDSDTSDDPMAILAFLATTETPSSMQKALQGPDAEGWQAALDKELLSIRNAGTWDLVDRADLPEGTRPIDSRLVLATKLDPTGGDDHTLKVRLVAKGFTQRPGIDYVDTFSPVGHRQSLRLMLSLAASLDLEVQALDITTAFLHGTLQETIYMFLPPEVSGRQKVAKLRKALYGLKQAGRCWNEEIDTWLKSKGWQPNDDDACVYILRSQNGDISMILFIHVDDSAIAGKDDATIDAFIAVLNDRFPCKRQGAIKHFLAMEIHRDRKNRHLWIIQHQYMLRILQRFNLLDCRYHAIPMPPSTPGQLDEPAESDVKAAAHLPYRELTGSLQYLATMTRPDIAFAVNKMSSYNNKWTAKHFEICKGILRYIAGTKDIGLRLGGTLTGLEAYVDADFNACVTTRKSTTGWIVKYNGGLIAWKSKKQSVQSHSTAEAEYMAIDDAARDIVWERRCLTTMGDTAVNSIATILHSDNQSAIKMAKNRSSHDSTKHIDFRFHYIRDLIHFQQIKLVYVESENNVADILTKALPRDLFVTHRNSMGLSKPGFSGSV
jgi:hypothetical protein